MNNNQMVQQRGRTAYSNRTQYLKQSEHSATQTINGV